jgi:Carboxypeptidase regulatory-like domain
MSDALMIPIPERRAGGPAGWGAKALLLLSIACIPGISSGASAPSITILSGKILGLVTDAAGVPQMGAAVILLTQQDKFSDRALTDERGAFSFDGLAAGAYSIRVSLASFLPVSKSGIVVQPGLHTLLNVSLAGLFSSIQLVYPTPDQRAIMNDDWKWVLRTSNATRPVLRLMPNWSPDDNGPAHRASTGIFSDTRALVRVSAGDGGHVTSFGNESDLGTAFALATSVLGKNQLQFSGNLGYAPQSGAPSAGFRTSYSRGEGEDTSPEVTVTMRQMFLPGRTTAALLSLSGGASAPMLRTLSVSMHEGTQITDSIRLEYGFSMDAVTFLDHGNYFSPFSRLIYTMTENDEIQFSYSSGVPQYGEHPGERSSESDLRNDINALALFPRISVRDSHMRVQQSQNYEMGYRRTSGSRTYTAAVFRENISNAALTIAGADGLFPAGDVLPDLFTTSSVFNAGGYQSLGYMASVTQSLGDNLKVSTMYGSGDALVAGRSEIPGQSPEDLRSVIRRGRRQAVTTQISCKAPWTGTEFSASYQITDRRSVTPSHYFATQGTRAEPGLNIYLRQPIRTFSLIPVHMEASADLRNLLADGYLPFSSSDGRPILLMSTPRSFRGGLSFIF